MSILKKFQNYILHTRRKQALKKKKADLREFVYLDEVSVYSLLASRLGAIATEFTDTQARTLQGEITGSAGVDFGIAKGEYSSHVLESRTRGSQVLRKSIIQSQFKDLYESEKDSLAIQPIVNSKLPEIRHSENLAQLAKNSNSNNWIISPQMFSRGRLLEIEVQLEAESIFRISTVVSTLLDILDENPEMVGIENYENLLQAKTVDHVLEKLLVGLVPVRGKVIDYSLLELDGEQWIVHTKLLNQLEAKESLFIYPLYVVGVAEQSLFWKDIRRVLFAEAKYRVFCRIAQDGIQTFWTPVKLVQVLETVAPDLAKKVNVLGFQAFNGVIQVNNNGNQNTDGISHVESALITYANFLANQYKYEILDNDLLEIKTLAAKHYSSFTTQKGRRICFNEVGNLIFERTGKNCDPTAVVNYRARALQEAGLDFSGNYSPNLKVNNSQIETSSSDRYIDSEIVAIYW